MRKEDFKELLTDLYSAYNPDFIKYIPQLVDKYHRLEFDAVQNILIKYNHESYAHYDPEKSNDEYIHSLIKDYNEGNRSLKDFTIEMHIKRKQEQENKKSEEEKIREEENRKELGEVKRKISDTEKKLEEAEKILKEKIEKIKNFEPVTKKVSIYDDVEISIKSNYTDSELILPNKDVLAGLGKDTRLIVQDKEGKMVGLIVEDILYDCVSHPMGTPIVEIIINKG